MVEVKTFLMGIVQDSENPHIELRFVREPEGEWEPNLIVNREEQTITEFPPCFEPTDEVLLALKECVWEDWSIHVKDESSGAPFMVPERFERRDLKLVGGNPGRQREQAKRVLEEDAS